MGVRGTRERWKTTKSAIDMFNEMLQELAQGREGKVIYVDLRETLASERIDALLEELDGDTPRLDDDDLKIDYERLARRYWSDELHPDGTGFSKIAKQLADQMQNEHE